MFSLYKLVKVVREDWLGNLANYKEDYNVSLVRAVCTVTVRFFVLGVMLH